MVAAPPDPGTVLNSGVRPREIASPDLTEKRAAPASIVLNVLLLPEIFKMNALIEKNRAQIRSLAAKRGIRNVRLFGSMALNTASLNSDVDLLVELEEGRSGLALGGFLQDVSELLGKKVDVVTEGSLHSRIREQVLKEAVVV